jgi:ferritin
MGNLDPVVQDALNKQVTHERQNSAIYLAIANQFDVLDLVGMAKFARAASAEEQAHAQRIIDYIVDRYGAPVTDALTSVDILPALTMMNAPRILFSGALQREQVTTEQIKTVYDLAEDADDPQTCQFLLWFLEEQTKSEREISEIVAWAQFAEGNAAAILALDAKLGG